jgi:hypothetical protein
VNSSGFSYYPYCVRTFDIAEATVIASLFSSTLFGTSLPIAAGSGGFGCSEVSKVANGDSDSSKGPNMGLPFLTPLFTGTTPLLSETTKMGPPQFLTLFMKAAEYLDVFSRRPLLASALGASISGLVAASLVSSGSERLHGGK